MCGEILAVNHSITNCRAHNIKERDYMAPELIISEEFKFNEIF